MPAPEPEAPAPPPESTNQAGVTGDELQGGNGDQVQKADTHDATQAAGGNPQPATGAPKSRTVPASSAPTMRVVPPADGEPPSRNTAHELQPAARAEDIQPARKTDEVQPAAHADSVQRTKRAEDVQPATKLEETPPEWVVPAPGDPTGLGGCVNASAFVVVGGQLRFCETPAGRSFGIDAGFGLGGGVTASTASEPDEAGWHGDASGNASLGPASGTLGGGAQKTPDGWKPRGRLEGNIGVAGLGPTEGLYYDEEGFHRDSAATGTIATGDDDAKKKRRGRGQQRVGVKIQGMAIGGFTWSTAQDEEDTIEEPADPIPLDGAPNGLVVSSAAPSPLLIRQVR